MLFKSSVTEVARLDCPLTLNGLKNEPMLFAADGLYSVTNGGDITKEFLWQLADHFDDCPPIVVDVRAHMLKPTWYPSIPGWHFDECPRAAAFLCPRCGHEDSQGAAGDYCRECGAGPYRALNQPNIWADPKGQPRHFLCILDFGTGSLTEFITDEIDTSHFEPIEEDENVWGWCDRNISAMPKNYFSTSHVESGVIYEFGHGDFHRAIPATGDGWRLFLRATVNSRRPVFNEIRNQTQVYLPDPTKGW